MSARSLSLGGRDIVKEVKEKKSIARRDQVEERKRKYEMLKKEEEEEQRQALSRLDHVIDSAESEDDNDDNEDELDPSFISSSWRPKKEVKPLVIPPEILFRERVVMAVVRGGINAEPLVDVVAAIITEVGGDLDDYFLNADNVRDRIARTSQDYADKDKESWVPPVAPILQWDEKKDKDRDGKEEIRMPVVVSGDERPPKSIGSFKLPSSKAISIATTVVEEAASWGIGSGPDQVKPVLTLWDTTNANSGLLP